MEEGDAYAAREKDAPPAPRGPAPPATTTRTIYGGHVPRTRRRRG